jgi:hypothetical protein
MQTSNDTKFNCDVRNRLSDERRETFEHCLKLPRLRLVLLLALLGAGACAEGGGGSGGTGCAGLDCKLRASDPAAGNFFGGSVALDGDVVAIGAVGHDENGSSSGSVYLYRYDPETLEWHQDRKLTATDPSPEDGFGHTVALDRAGKVAAVGANLDDSDGDFSGSAYVIGL